MGCSTMAKNVHSACGSCGNWRFHGPVQSWASAAHEVVKEQLLLGPAAESGPRKMSLDEEKKP